jgi:hypothetical protein
MTPHAQPFFGWRGINFVDIEFRLFDAHSELAEVLATKSDGFGADLTVFGSDCLGGSVSGLEPSS